MPSIAERLLEERARLGMTQPAVADACRVTIRTQRNYESGERSPDALYLAAFAAVGGDVRYVITGSRDYTPPPPLTAEEQTLIERWREASREVKNAAMGALLGAGAASGVRQMFAGKVGHVTQGDSHFSGGTFAVHDERRTTYGPTSKAVRAKPPKKT